MIKKILPYTSFFLGVMMFNKHLVVFGIIIFAISVLLNFQKSNFPIKKFILFVLPFLVIIITSVALGFLDGKWLEKRTSFVIFSVLIFYGMRDENFYLIKKNIFKGFVWGSIITSILLLLIATFKSIKNEGFIFYNSELSHLTNNNYFLHSTLSKPTNLHPSYLSIYLLFAILLLLNKEVILNFKLKKIVIGILSILLVLLQAKIILPLLLIFTLITIKKNKKIVLYFIPILVIIVLINKRFLVSNYSPPNKVTKSLYLNKGWNAINIRMQLNKVSLELSKKVSKKEFVFGVGQKEVGKKLITSYKNNNLKYFAKRKFGTHNQYFSDFLKGGIISLMGMLIFMFSMLKSSLKLKNTNFIFLSLTLILYSFLEEFVSLQTGIIFVTLFASIYIKQLHIESRNQTI